MKISKLFFSMMILMAGFVLTQNIAAQTAPPDSVIKDLYKIHLQDDKSNGDRILNGKSRKNLDKFFDKTLADLIWKDLTTHTDDVGVIDFDIFCDSQDPNTKNLSVGTPKITGTKAAVTVNFTNDRAKQSVKYQMVKRNSDWKIADINYGKESLLGYFKDQK